MYEPLISVLIPTFEPRADFLRAAIDSVIAQTEHRWILHINDDTSTIDVHTIVENYLKDPRITFARNRERLGIGGNWNSCLRSSLSPRERARVRGSTPYVQFLFQDDLWDPQYLQRCSHILETHPTIGFVSAEHSYKCEKNLAVRPLYDHLRETRQNLLSPGLHHGQEFLQQWLERGLHPNIIGEPSFVMFRQSLIECIGMFDEHMPQFLDVEYWTRCLAKADWYYLGENLGTFRVHTKGASEQNRRESRGMADRLLCVERAIRLLPTLRPRSTAILSRTLEDMIGKFQREKGHGFFLKNPLRFFPMLPFYLRHPFIVGKALLKKEPT